MVRELAPNLIKLLNQQLEIELQAAQFYRVGYAALSKIQYSLPGLSKYFKEATQEELDHSNMVIEYLNLRGADAIIPLTPGVDNPPTDDYDSILDFLTRALIMEQTLTEFVCNLHREADKKKDVHLSSYYEDTFIPEQYKAIAEVEGLINKLKRMGPGLGLQMFDNSL